MPNFEDDTEEETPVLEDNAKNNGNGAVPVQQKEPAKTTDWHGLQLIYQTISRFIKIYQA